MRGARSAPTANPLASTIAPVGSRRLDELEKAFVRHVVALDGKRLDGGTNGNSFIPSRIESSRVRPPSGRPPGTSTHSFQAAANRSPGDGSRGVNAYCQR